MQQRQDRDELDGKLLPSTGPYNYQIPSSRRPPNEQVKQGVWNGFGKYVFQIKISLRLAPSGPER